MIVLVAALAYYGAGLVFLCLAAWTLVKLIGAVG